MVDVIQGRELELTLTGITDCSRYQSYRRPYRSGQGMDAVLRFMHMTS